MLARDTCIPEPIRLTTKPPRPLAGRQGCSQYSRWQVAANSARAQSDSGNGVWAFDRPTAIMRGERKAAWTETRVEGVAGTTKQASNIARPHCVVAAVALSQTLRLRAVGRNNPALNSRHPLEVIVPCWISKMLYFSALTAVAFISAEVTSRVEDQIREGVGFGTFPNREADLIVVDGYGTRGRPNGRFKKWKLNEWGFRSGPISLKPRPGISRLMILGASEAFGLHETEGREFSLQLEQLLQAHGDYEVANAAVVGMTVGSMNSYWRHWARQFHPTVVVVYATPLFYLGEVAPGVPVIAKQPPAVVKRPWRSRYLDRISDLVDVPDFVQAWHKKRWISARISNKPEGWLYREVPDERLDLFEEHLRLLGEMVENDGAQVILCTHAQPVCRSIFRRGPVPIRTRQGPYSAGYGQSCR